MSRATWFGRRAVQKQRAARCRLQVERLEDRNLMSFQVLATLGDPVSLPTGPAFRINDFEPNAINNKGDILFGNDLGTTNDPTSFFGEGVFLRSHGQETVLASSTAPAPGGGTFDFSFLGPSSLNDQGDAALAFLLQPFGAPFGVNAGTYRYSHATHAVTPVVVPGITPVPGGGVFAGTFFGPGLNNRGDLLFGGIVPTDKGVHIPGEPYGGLGMGVFKADVGGHITSVVSPGDPAPGGGTFDIAGDYGGFWVNDRGDLAFTGHVAGEEAIVPGFPPQSAFLSAIGSLYVKNGATGQISSIAHAGDSAPGGGAFRQIMFPEINNRGDVLFTGDLTPAPDANQVLGVFLDSGGKIIPIARPGDAMPGGGHLVTASIVGGNTHLNNKGDVVFNAALDTNHNGIPDTGLFEWSHGHLSLIARSGTVLPGVGTVKDFTFNVITTPPPTIVVPNSGADNNDRGQVLFGATLEDGRSVMLLDTPTPANLPHNVAPISPATVSGAAATQGPLPGDVAVSTILASMLAGAPTGHLATVNAGPPVAAAQVVTPPANQTASGLALPNHRDGALPDRAVDAFFATLGDQILEDPLSSEPPLL